MLRAARVAWHLAHGIALVLFRFPASSLAGRDRMIQAWSARLLRILAVQLELSGTPPAATTAMLAANHVSWLDVYVLNAVCPARFVAKSEIAGWPLIGVLARGSGNLFIRRGSKRDILRVNRELETLLAQGTAITVFPEGTTSTGHAVLSFRPALLQAAVNRKARLHPVAIRYERADGSLCEEAAFVGDVSFAASLWGVLRQPALRVRLQFLTPLASNGSNRKTLAREARAAVEGALAWRAVNAAFGHRPKTVGRTAFQGLVS